MPELPEVEAAARRLRAAAVGRVIRAARTFHDAARRALPDRDAAQLAGRRVVGVRRLGKHQAIDLDDGSTLHAHFRMTGDWDVGRDDAPLPPHARVALSLDDGTRVALAGARVLDGVRGHAPGAAPEPRLGPDALDPARDGAALRAALRGRRAAVKPALLDQRVVAGGGNIYASEALWRAGIDPRTPAASLGPARVGRLADAVRAVLHDALDAPGRYQDGEALERLRVYDREGEPCVRCGAPVRRTVQAGRSTYYCARCQKR
ncbi:bifunctional DNA-formamidopyrimidine glycosylase/DNA-(apurinic or apyrimidinic site) lyase [Roseisolibacter sp. H3M3-2]|uniref:bifunctional DNA-formamidopyrimidine glycosylase/DNA-(apurinic or apyrimidinic site) lyase n=1 Tax=Roseisolibacter sp. H3M3-2 TaxID=3031323 RepID=UPI0023DB060D|nr:bifunctional DNA-formamidopyrimidine glycosylase/DNA-(apurinic or apyrimidinic site) lyase [Roseisolibacter sp. H3M3-2]MDF1504022.1 bifunctional DNA-formamidopyrimidine glycosylase/DNA-(apurinic or apyrimidinic site) lyase [Roseisolibacter sp. H3M3-2]